MGIEIINPVNDPAWNERLLSADEYSVFHTAEWARAISETYNYKPLYFSLVDRGHLLATMPFMEIKSCLTGSRGVSLPFTDECNPICTNADFFKEIFTTVVAHGKKCGWSYLELRGDKGFISGMPEYRQFLSHKVNLAQGTNTLHRNLRDSAKRNINKANRAGIRVYHSDSGDALTAFYRLNCMTRKLHGLPPQPVSFFKNLQRHIIARNLGRIFLAEYRGECIAGAVFLHFGKMTFYKYGASNRKYQHLRGSNLVIWEAIKWYAENKFQTLSFGRTDPDNAGLRRFKTGWGAEETPLRYYRYDLHENKFLQRDTVGTTERTLTAVFRYTPMPMLRMIGSVLYRHVG